MKAPITILDLRSMLAEALGDTIFDSARLQTACRAAIAGGGVHVMKRGRGPGSLEGDDTAGLDYTVVSGERVPSVAPWLWRFFLSRDLLALLEGVSQTRLRPSDDLASCVNINGLASGGRYEWHVDRVPYTLLLFVTAHPDNGAFCYRLEEVEQRIYPVPGMAVFFDGSDIPHGVMQTFAERITIPLVFRPAGDYTPVGAGNGYLFE